MPLNALGHVVMDSLGVDDRMTCNILNIEMLSKLLELAQAKQQPQAAYGSEAVEVVYLSFFPLRFVIVADTR